MVSIEQKGYLRLRGYRVVHTDRGEDGSLSVEYPQEREDAVCKRFSQEVFSDQETAWQFAWDDHVSRGERPCAV